MIVTLGCGRSNDTGVSFQEVKSVLSANCSQCHSAFSRPTEETLKAGGYVFPGDAARSPLFRFLKGSAVGGPESMPKVGRLSDEERAQIKGWIDGMNDRDDRSEAFKAASVVITSHCIQCHRGDTGLPNFVLATEADWVQSGFVVRGDPAASPLLWRVAGAGYGREDEDMPFDQPPISSAALHALQTWIATMRASTQ